MLPFFRRFIAENVAVCSKCCDKDGDEESLTAGSRTQDYAALQWSHHVDVKQHIWLLIVFSVVSFGEWFHLVTGIN